VGRTRRKRTPNYVRITAIHAPEKTIETKTSVFLLCLNPRPGSESPLPGLRKLDLTRENLNTLLGHGFSKHKATSTLSRGSGQTTGGHAPGTPRRERERELGWAGGQWLSS